MSPRNHYPKHSHYSDFHHHRFALPLFELYANGIIEYVLSVRGFSHSIFYLWHSSMWNWVVYLHGRIAFQPSIASVYHNLFVPLLIDKQVVSSLEIFQVMLLWASVYKIFWGVGKDACTWAFLLCIYLGVEFLPSRIFHWVRNIQPH